MTYIVSLGQKKIFNAKECSLVPLIFELCINSLQASLYILKPLAQICEASFVTESPAQTASTAPLHLCKSLLPQRTGYLKKYQTRILTQSFSHLIPFILPCLVVQEPVLCRSDSAGRTGSPGFASATAATLPPL